MGEEVVWIKGYVPRRVPKLQYPYVAVDFPVPVKVIDPADTEVSAHMVTASRRPGDAWEFAILEHEDRLWRPIHRPRYFREEEPTALEMLARDEKDNPLAEVAKSRYMQSVDTSSSDARAAEPDPEAVTSLGAALHLAGAEVCIIDGVAYRECEEPTWIVTPARFGEQGVLLQPFCGKPGRTAEVAWFSHSRLDHARAFAAEEAARKGVGVVERGSITASGPARFDDISFAGNRVIDSFARVSRFLGGTIPEEAIQLAGEARMANADYTHALSLAERAAELLAGFEGRPDIDALLHASHMARAQVSYFLRNAVFSEEDESALDSLSFPSP